MLEHGYKPSTANRDLSSLGSCYRWAKEKRLASRGFRSPTLGVRRFEEGIRRVDVSRAHNEALRTRALVCRDRRFGVFVALLIDTGARKSEILARHWRDFDLDRCQITCAMTKTVVPRVLHFREETAGLIRRVYPKRAPDALPFEGRVPGQPVNFRKAWTTVVAEVGLPDLHMHDVRHAAAASLLRAEVTLVPAVHTRRLGIELPAATSSDGLKSARRDPSHKPS